MTQAPCKAEDQSPTLDNGDVPGEKQSCPLSKSLEQMKSRERKRFHRMRLPEGVVHTMFALKIAINVDDLRRSLCYWKHQSALKSCGLSEVLEENSYPKKRSPDEAALSMSVWDFPGLVRDHVNRYTPERTPRGLYRPPLVITIADVLPLSTHELITLHRKSRSKLLGFFFKHMQTSCADYKQCMIESADETPVSIDDTPAANEAFDTSNVTDAS